MKSWWFSGMFYCVIFGVLYDELYKNLDKPIFKENILMRDFVIITETTADLPASYIEENM